MRTLSLSVICLLGMVGLLVVTPRPAAAQPTGMVVGKTAGVVEDVGYRYRRYRYGRPYYRPYYRPYAYRPYYRPYAYRPYYRPYAYYRPYYRPGVNIWFGF